MRPALQHPPELLLKAQSVRVVLFDVDGVLTDGGLYFSATGESLKRFHTLDGLGLKMLQSAGVVPVVITGRDSRPLRNRLQALGITQAFFGIEDKLAQAQDCLVQLQLPWDKVAAIGDDWPDLPLLRRSALSAAPPNAHAEVLASVDFVTARHGGHGAVRDLCDLLLMARGVYAGLLVDAAR